MGNWLKCWQTQSQGGNRRLPRIENHGRTKPCVSPNHSTSAACLRWRWILWSARSCRGTQMQFQDYQKNTRWSWMSVACGQSSAAHWLLCPGHRCSRCSDWAAEALLAVIGQFGNGPCTGSSALRRAVIGQCPTFLFLAVSLMAYACVFGLHI